MRVRGFLSVVVCPTGAALVQGSDWAQFRGPNGSGRPAKETPLPADIGPSTNVVWKTPLPPGHSSPVVVGDHIYLTGVRDKKLLTIAMERATGTVLWEVETPAPALEKVHRIGSHAQPTPVADEERVISLFGSAGLSCHDRAGKLVWHVPMGPFQNDFGAGSSPILVGDWVILSQDHDQNSFLIALDKRTGKTMWKTDRSEFLRGYCTPVIWEVEGRKQIVVAGTLRTIGYDVETGKELWTVRGLSRNFCTSPSIGDDGRLYLSGWAAGGDPGAAIEIDPFDDVVKKFDKNGNGKLERDELANHPFGERFTQVDTQADGSVVRGEYDRFRDLFQKGKNAVIAVRAGGKGDISETHVVWANTKQVPFCSSPLHHSGLVYTIKGGGLFASIDANDGKVHKYERLPDNGTFYASPVAGDGKIYLASESGVAIVVQAGKKWTVLAKSDFEEEVYATPAIADGRIYFRTARHLYCFGQPEKK